MTKTQRLLQLAVWYLRCNLIIAALAIFDWWPFQSEMFDMKPIIVLSSELPCNILITLELKLMLSLDPSQLPAPEIYLSNLNFECIISLNYKVSRHCLNAWSLPTLPLSWQLWFLRSCSISSPLQNWFKMKDLYALNVFIFEDHTSMRLFLKLFGLFPKSESLFDDPRILRIISWAQSFDWAWWCNFLLMTF